MDGCQLTVVSRVNRYAEGNGCYQFRNLVERPSVLKVNLVRYPNNLWKEIVNLTVEIYFQILEIINLA